MAKIPRIKQNLGKFQQFLDGVLQIQEQTLDLATKISILSEQDPSRKDVTSRLIELCNSSNPHIDNCFKAATDLRESLVGQLKGDLDGIRESVAVYAKWLMVLVPLIGILVSVVLAVVDHQIDHVAVGPRRGNLRRRRPWRSDAADRLAAARRGRPTCPRDRPCGGVLRQDRQGNSRYVAKRRRIGRGTVVGFAPDAGPKRGDDRAGEFGRRRHRADDGERQHHGGRRRRDEHERAGRSRRPARRSASTWARFRRRPKTPPAT